MFLINTSLAAFATGDLYFVAVAAAATVGVGGVSNLTSLFADIHFILISLISLFKVFIVSIRYLMMYPDNKIRINTNKSIVCICGTLFLFKEGYKKYDRQTCVGYLDHIKLHVPLITENTLMTLVYTMTSSFTSFSFI